MDFSPLCPENENQRNEMTIRAYISLFTVLSFISRYHRLTIRLVDVQCFVPSALS